ncbi:hypothetical protein DER45DRAFT_577810 [Fusarium avenaceum]|nr:hypothetical protein DER45DRAFT_577810 [Fusarium avenaceum]
MICDWLRIQGMYAMAILTTRHGTCSICVLLLSVNGSHASRINNTLYAYSIPSVKGEPWNSEVNQRQSLLATLVSRTL